MRQGSPLRTIALVTLLLPGLVFAAPMVGACGLCDRGVPCPNMTAPSPAATAHSCCGEAADAPAKAAPSSLGSMACDCGRDAPVAVAAVEAPAPENDRAEALHAAAGSDNLSHPLAPVAGERTLVPPPHPLIFLIDCVFLT